MPALWKETSALRSAINCLLTEDAEKRIRYTKQILYEYGDKPGKCLAYLAKKRAESQAIAAIVDSKGNRIHDTGSINDCFKEFYANLYSSDQTNDAPQLMEDFFAQINLPPF